MHTFTLNVITSGRQEITVQKDRDTTASPSVASIPR